MCSYMLLSLHWRIYYYHKGDRNHVSDHQFSVFYHCVFINMFAFYAFDSILLIWDGQEDDNEKLYWIYLCDENCFILNLSLKRLFKFSKCYQNYLQRHENIHFRFHLSSYKLLQSPPKNLVCRISSTQNYPQLRILFLDPFGNLALQLENQIGLH